MIYGCKYINIKVDSASKEEEEVISETNLHSFLRTGQSTHLSGGPHSIVIGQMHELVDEIRLIEIGC